MAIYSEQRNLLPEAIYQKLDAAEKQVLAGQVTDAEKGLQHIWENINQIRSRPQINNSPHGEYN